MSKRMMLEVGVLASAVLLSYGFGQVGWLQAGSSTGGDSYLRSLSSSSSPPARSLGSDASRVSDMELGLLGARLTGGGGGEYSATPAANPGLPGVSASTTVVSERVGKSGAGTTQDCPVLCAGSQQDATFGTPARREQGFETGTRTEVAQQVEQPPVKGLVAGSSPALGAILAQSHWPASLWPAVECIVARESKGDPGVTGAAGERGLMQVHPTNAAYLEARGLAWVSMYDPLTNLNAGYELYLYWGGFSAWNGGCR